MKLHEQIFFEIKNKKLNYKSYSQLFATLSKNLNTSIDSIAKCVNKMIQDGDLIENGRKQLVSPEELGIYKGTVNANPKGFAFIEPKIRGIKGFEIKKGDKTDVFVPASMLFGALDGDEVLYRLEGKDSGVIVKILKRYNKNIVGKLVRGNNSIYKGIKLDSENFYLIADNPKFGKPVLIPQREIKEAKENERVVAELTFQPEGKGVPVGKVIEILFGDDVEQGLVSILCENQIPNIFPEKVIGEADNLKVDYELERKKRVDLTNKLIVTIDGEDAKDLDDAISLEKDGDCIILGVHIADVGNFVTRDSVIDKEAFNRGTSVYFPGKVYPMLPQALSNNLCSLNPDEEKLAITVEIKLNKFAEIISSKIYESIIKSKARLTYNLVQDILNKKNIKINNGIANENILDGRIDNKIITMLFEMETLSNKLSALRNKNGALNLDLPETYFQIDENTIKDVKRKEREGSYILIENFMILANKVIAEIFCKLEIPFIYRIHGEPSKQRINDIITVLQSLGVNVKMSKKITSFYLQNILNSIELTQFRDVGNKLILRALEKAIYSEKCLGHFGLALPYYCHFTSPIRRYPDLAIHRIIKDALSVCKNRILETTNLNFAQDVTKKFKNNYDLEEFVIDAALQSSERERKADQAERDADDLFKAKYMEDKIGNIYTGKISGVSSFGIFVELENTVEGIIKIENLPADDYIFDEKKFILKGKKRKFIIGQNLCVKVISSNILTRKIEFLLKET